MDQKAVIGVPGPTAAGWKLKLAVGLDNGGAVGIGVAVAVFVGTGVELLTGTGEAEPLPTKVGQSPQLSVTTKGTSTAPGLVELADALMALIWKPVEDADGTLREKPPVEPMNPPASMRALVAWPNVRACSVSGSGTLTVTEPVPEASDTLTGGRGMQFGSGSPPVPGSGVGVGAGTVTVLLIARRNQLPLLKSRNS